MDYNKLQEDLARRAGNTGIDRILHGAWVDVIDRIGQTILGLLLTILLVTIPLIIFIELCYINFPFFRVEMVDKLRYKGNGHLQKALGLTLHDAIKAIEQANTTKTGKSATLIYMGIKFKWIFIFAFSLCIYLGGIGTIISLIIHMLSGLIEIIIDAVT